jgi:hypothetical protein
MHKKHAKDGLVILTVDIDPRSERDPLPKIQGKVRKKVADFGLAPLTNLILDESDKVIEEKLRFDGPPCVYVFDRQGKWRKLQPSDGDPEMYHQRIEALVGKLLAAK